MWRRGIVLASLLVLSLLAGISELVAQTRPRQHIRDSDTTLATIATNFRTRGGDFYARDILTQRLGPESRQKMDALADSLTAIAVEYEPGDGVEKLRIASAAAYHIARAAVAKKGVPYTGAFERLVRIAEEAPDVGIRGQGLNGIAALPEKERSLAYLRRVATSTEMPQMNAYIAVELLSQEMGADGVALLEELSREGLVRDKWAADLLESIAYIRGWK